MQIKWKEQQSTIVGFGVILLALGVFGYLLWAMNKEPMAEVNVTEPSPTLVESETSGLDVIKEKLPDYPITKVDTTGWEYRETKLGDVGVRYKVMNKDLDNRSGDSLLFLSPHFDLGNDIGALMFGADNKARLGKGYDEIIVNHCINCGGGPYDPYPGRISINIVESSNLNLSDIENILLSQSCDYRIVKNPGDMMTPYTLDEKCSTGEKFISYNYSSEVRESQKISDIINLNAKITEVTKYKNSFINTDKESMLIKYPIAIGAQDFSNDNVDNPEIVFDNQLAFIIDLGNNKFVIITQTAFPENEEMKATNIMYTILSTIEVL